MKRRKPHLGGGIELRVGSLEEMRKDINRVFDDPETAATQPSRILYLPPHELPKVLSSERIRLIHEIRKHKYTIGELAARLKRKRENISRDLSVLQHYGLVEIRRNGRQKHPTTKACITVNI